MGNRAYVSRTVIRWRVLSNLIDYAVAHT